jgi:signal transduction histidine kinase
MDRPTGLPRTKLRLQWFPVIAAVAMTTLALAACISLGLGAHLTGRRAERLGVAAEHAQLTETLRADLLDLARTSNLVLSMRSPDREKQRTELQAKVYRDIGELRRTSVPADLGAIDKVESDVRALEIARQRGEARSPDERGAAGPTAPLEATLASLGELRQADAGRVPEERAGIAAWTRISDVISWLASILLVLLSTALAVGAYKILAPPLLGLSAAMKRFSNGDRTARVGASPALEIDSAARSFNEMAERISSQHKRMLDSLDVLSRRLQKPMRAMRASIAELEPGGKSPQPEENTRRVLATMSGELEHLDQVVLGFVDASRIEWQRLDLQQTRRDAREFLTRMVGPYETFSPMHTVSLRLPEQPVCMRFDEARMSQVLNTLLSNAFQYSPEGGAVEVLLTAETGPEGESEEARGAVIRVTDHGVGIPKEQIEKIFEPFHNLQPDRQPRSGAVALSVARRIVEAHRGSMSAESQPGVGSTFHVRLPVDVEVAREAPGASEQKANEKAESKPRANEKAESKPRANEKAEEERARPSSIPHPEPSH